MRCTSGFVPFKDKVSSEDADVVKALREAGAIPVATTNLPELCLSTECTNKIYGRTHNPYDTRRTCGGSSGGEGALIAAAGSVFGIGSDYAGSIRVPAFLNGVFGHKVSSGVVPVDGVGSGMIPEQLFKFLSVGPMCRYAEDLLPLMKIISRNNSKLKLDKPVDLKELKIYYALDIGDCPLVTPVKPDVQKAMKMVLSHFEDRYGIKPVQVHLENLGNSMYHFFNTVLDAGAPSISEAMAQLKGHKNIPVEFVKWCFGYSDHIFATVLQAFLGDVLRMSSKVQEEGLVEFAKLRSEFNHLLKDDNSVFLLPTQPEPATYHNESNHKQFNYGYTAVYNALYYPATHLPVLLSQGLPVGVQCIANANNDRLTIAVAEEVGRAFRGWQPPSAVIT